MTTTLAWDVLSLFPHSTSSSSNLTQQPTSEMRLAHTPSSVHNTKYTNSSTGSSSLHVSIKKPFSQVLQGAFLVILAVNRTPDPRSPSNQDNAKYLQILNHIALSMAFVSTTADTIKMVFASDASYHSTNN